MQLAAHLVYEHDADSLALLRAQLDPNVTLTVGPELPSPPDYHVLIVEYPQREQLEASPNLRTLIIPWAGLPSQTRELLLTFPHIAVHNLHHNTAPVAEMAITLLLTAAKSIVPVDRIFRGHDWTPCYKPYPSPLMQNKTALILGYGAIGQAVARICFGLGIKVVGVRRRVSAPLTVPPDEIHPTEALQRLLPRANALLICLPHTAETDGLIGEQELALLPPDAILVNVGRGTIVDQKALYYALRDGRLYAAGLDVWYNYPSDEAARAHTPPADYPFNELENVVMSPHLAWNSKETDERRTRDLADLLNAAARGEVMPNRVDLEIGY